MSFVTSTSASTKTLCSYKNKEFHKLECNDCSKNDIIRLNNCASLYHYKNTHSISFSYQNTRFQVIIHFDSSPFLCQTLSLDGCNLLNWHSITQRSTDKHKGKNLNQIKKSIIYDTCYQTEVDERKINSCNGFQRVYLWSVHISSRTVEHSSNYKWVKHNTLPDLFSGYSSLLVPFKSSFQPFLR